MDLNALRLEISSAMIGEDVGEEMVSGDEKVEEVIDRRGVTRRKVFMEEGRRAIRDIMGELLTRLWNARLLREPFLCEREKGLLGHLLSQQAPTQGARNGSQGFGRRSCKLGVSRNPTCPPSYSMAAVDSLLGPP